MGLFSKKEERFIGIDIGAGGIKLVELLFEDKTYKLMTYGATRRVGEDVSVPITENIDEAVKHVKALLSESGVKSDKVIASLPVHAVFSSIIAIPDVKTRDEQRALVERQAVKLMPMPLEEMVIDFQVLDGEVNPEKKDKNGKFVGVKGDTSADKNVRVLITGASKHMVQTYTSIFKGAGLSLMSLETEPFALIRSLVGSNTGPVMLLDIGAYRTNMTIVDKQAPFVNRSIQIGGAMVTKRIAEQMSVGMEEAEQMKYDLASSPGDHAEVPDAVKELFKPIVNEISYAMRVYAESDLTEFSYVEKVILTGGSAHLPGLDTYLTESLNVRTFVGDPWARVQVNEEMRPVLDAMGPKFAVALGLAMHSKTAAEPAKKS